MSDWNPIAKLLVIGGIALIVTGLAFQFLPRIFPSIGRLPGDIVIQRDNATIYIPITTMLIVSVVGSIVLTLIARLLNGDK